MAYNSSKIQLLKLGSDSVLKEYMSQKVIVCKGHRLYPVDNCSSCNGYLQVGLFVCIQLPQYDGSYHSVWAY